jgi:hypothetical protein
MNSQTYAFGIRDLVKTYAGSRFQGSKRHCSPDQDPQHCSPNCDKMRNTKTGITNKHPGSTTLVSTDFILINNHEMTLRVSKTYLGMNRGHGIHRRHGGGNGDGVGGGDVVRPNRSFIFHLHTAARGLFQDDRSQQKEGDGCTKVFCNT